MTIKYNKLYVVMGRKRRYNNTWCNLPRAIWDKSPTNLSVMQRISAKLHHLSRHSVPAIESRWKGADDRFRKAHECKLWKLTQRGIIKDRY